ncbi:ABC transporter substrate-binding protein [Haloferax larsenii]|uniref:Amino acid/amide ABC transporter substrate-binding protein, HAAT family n=1 Tax=Haloferax larsenii TaxID=302484 RepID=A0A1H7NQS9_HALLR|nr:ABC transporter substrate-binding protein [Haloferax larsenii]SEL25883.1 amino acid/amide ABC transporter substrate-binding protein, HAAT family [Haloferax larsenii]
MSEGDRFQDALRRRRFMRLAGMAGVAGLAGCIGQEDVQEGGNTGGSDGGGGGDSGGDTTESGGNGDESSSEPVDVGVVIPFSGDLSDFGGPMMNALRMAQKDINAAGGPLGRELKLHDEDSGTDSTQGVNAANKLVDTNGVSAVIGAVSSGVTISIAKSVTIPNEVLHITSASSSPSISTLDDDDLVFRTRTNDRFVAKVMARIIEDQGVEKASVIFINNDFGEALADTFESSFSGTTTTTVGYESGQSSYQQVLAKAFEDDPGFVAFAGYPESGTTMLSQWAEEGYGGNWVLHTSLLSEDVISNVGAEVMNDMYGVRTKPPSGGATESFVSDYQEAYPDAQVFDPYSWNSYDALVSYALAVEKAGTTDAAEVKKAMREVSNSPGEAVGYTEFGAGAEKTGAGTDIDYSGPSGNVNYDDNGDVASDMVIVQVEDGTFANKDTIPADELV